MPTEKRQAFINAFKRLPQRVIWKWENDTMEGKTDNIFIGKWMPQFDILSKLLFGRFSNLSLLLMTIHHIDVI